MNLTLTKKIIIFKVRHMKTVCNEGGYIRDNFIQIFATN